MLPSPGAETNTEVPQQDVTQTAVPVDDVIDTAPSAEQNVDSQKPEAELSEAELHEQFMAAVNEAAKPKEATPGEQTKPDVDPEAVREKADGKKATDVQQQDVDPNAKPESEPEDEGEDRGEPFGKHPRWKKMVEARNQYREQANAVSQELESLRPQAADMGHITKFMQDSSLSAEDVKDGFLVMALMKSDPAKARERLQEYIGSLDEFLGHKLPADLQQEVDDGLISPERAAQFVRQRNEAAKTQAQLAATQQHQVQQQVEQQTAQARQAQASAVSQWEASTKQRDPDYALKQEWVVDQLKLLRTQYQVNTPEQAVQLAKMAYDAVNARLKKTIPARPEVRPSIASAHTAANPAGKPEPRSFEEACLLAANIT